MFSSFENFNSTFAQLSNFSLDALQTNEQEKKDDSDASKDTMINQVKDEESHNEHIQSLKDQNGLLCERNQELENFAALKDTDILQLREKVSSLEANLLTISQTSLDEKNHLLGLCASFESTIKSQQLEIRSLRESAGDKDGNNEVVDSLREEIQELVNRILGLENKLFASESKKVELEKQLSEMAEKYESKLVEVIDESRRSQQDQAVSHSQEIARLKVEMSSSTEKLEVTIKHSEQLVSELQSTLDHANSRFQRQSEEWREDFNAKEAEITECKSLLEKEKLAHSEELSSLETRHANAIAALKKQHEDAIVSVSVAAAQQADQEQSLLSKNESQFLELEKQNTHLHKQLQQKDDRIKELERDFTAVTESQLTKSTALLELERENAAKSTHIEELTAKIQALTEKLRELVQRHSESKNKLTAIQQDKDSEIIKLQLKLEAQKEQVEDQRAKLQEVTDRFVAVQKLWSESQKDQLRMDEERNANESRLLDLQQQLQEKEATLAMLADSKRKTEEDLGGLLRESERKYSVLADEFRKLQENSGSHADQAMALENYKRRSQLALKKANANAATLQDENNQLVTSVKALESQIDILKKNVEELTEEKTVLANQLTELSAAVATEQEKHRSQSQKINELEAVVEEYKKARNFVDKNIQGTLLNDQNTNNDNNNSDHRQHLKDTELGVSLLSMVVSSSEIGGTGGTTTSMIGGGTDAEVSHCFDSNDTEIAVVFSGSQHAPNDDYNPVVYPVQSSPSTLALHPSKSAPLSTSTSASGFVLVDELQQQVHSLQRLVAQRSVEVDESHHLLLREREEKEKLSQRCEELAAFLSRARKSTSSSTSKGNFNSNNSNGCDDDGSSIHSSNGSTNAVGGGSGGLLNLDYLKQVVYKFVTSTEISERQRVLPVLCALLSFTPKEKAQAMASLENWQSPVDSVIGMTANNVEAISSAFSWLGGLAGSSKESSQKK